MSEGEGPKHWEKVLKSLEGGDFSHGVVSNDTDIPAPTLDDPDAPPATLPSAEVAKIVAKLGLGDNQVEVVPPPTLPGDSVAFVRAVAPATERASVSEVIRAATVNDQAGYVTVISIAADTGQKVCDSSREERLCEPTQDDRTVAPTEDERLFVPAQPAPSIKRSRHLSRISRNLSVSRESSGGGEPVIAPLPAESRSDLEADFSWNEAWNEFWNGGWTYMVYGVIAVGAGLVGIAGGEWLLKKKENDETVIIQPITEPVVIQVKPVPVNLDKIPPEYRRQRMTKDHPFYRSVVQADTIIIHGRTVDCKASPAKCQQLAEGLINNDGKGVMLIPTETGVEQVSCVQEPEVCKYEIERRNNENGGWENGVNPRWHPNPPSRKWQTEQEF